MEGHTVQSQATSFIGSENTTNVIGPTTGLNQNLDASATVNTTSKARKSKSQVPCRFFGTAGGCRSGDQCSFLHGAPQGVEVRTDTDQQNQPASSVAKGDKAPQRKFQAKEVDRSRVVSKPAPKASVSKREHEIQQVKRRFNAVDVSTVDMTVLSFKLVPTDPDFPYELEALDCTLQVPKTYPDDGPHLDVQNKEIEKGFRINIESGFNSIVQSSPSGSLLAWLNTLDRQLETLLSGKKADTIKFVANKPTVVPVQTSATVGSSVAAESAKTVSVQSPRPMEPMYSPAEREAAAAKRSMDIRQLEARLGRQPMYAKSSDGIAYTLPIEPRRKFDLPQELQNIRTVRLFVPMLYPLLPCRIGLQAVARGFAQPIEQVFERKARESSEATLVSHINYLVINMHLMAKEVQQEENYQPDEIGIDQLVLSEDEQENPSTNTLDAQDDRSHIKIIPRPPEWHIKETDHDTKASDDSDESELSSEEDEAEPQIQQASSPEKGVSIDFLQLELHGIELLDVISLNLALRCLRCKEITEIENLRHTEAKGQPPRNLACRKCASEMSVAFHHQYLHQNSSRAGYLDLDNCTVADMLLSKFAPTCSNCSTTYSDPGVTAVRSDTALAICRKCHTKMSFTIPDVRFLLVSSTAKALPQRKARKPRENLGIRSGEPLPRHGRCKHYSKSFRWFRFGCCAKVYACDRCHDETEAHPNEHANRMICGYCSREQRYRPEDCGICKAILVGKKYTGFWEGGQGTRDKVRMSRKDPRKYKRRGGNSAVGGS